MAKLRPTYDLHLTVQSCSKLRDVITFGSMDPFVVVKSRMDVFSTDICEGGDRDPEFNTKMTFRVELSDELNVLVYEKGTISKTRIGNVIIPIGHWASGKMVTESFSLEHDHKNAGSIQISGQLRRPDGRAIDDPTSGADLADLGKAFVAVAVGDPENPYHGPTVDVTTFGAGGYSGVRVVPSAPTPAPAPAPTPARFVKPKPTFTPEQQAVLDSVRSAIAGLQSLKGVETEQQAIDLVYELHTACRADPEFVAAQFPELKPESIHKTVEDAGLSEEIWRSGAEEAFEDLSSFLEAAYSGTEIPTPMPEKPKALTAEQISFLQHVREAAVAFWNLATVTTEQAAIDVIYDLHSTIRLDPVLVVEEFPELAPDEMEKSLEESRQSIDEAGLTDVVWLSGSETAENDLMEFLEAAFDGEDVSGPMPQKPKALTPAEIALTAVVGSAAADLGTLADVTTEQDAIDILYGLHFQCRPAPAFVAEHFPELSPQHVGGVVAEAREAIEEAGLTGEVWRTGSDQAQEDLISFLEAAFSGADVTDPMPAKPEALTPAQVALLKLVRSAAVAFWNLSSAQTEQKAIDLVYSLHQAMRKDPPFVVSHFPDLAPDEVDKSLAVARQSIEEAGLTDIVWWKTGSEAVVEDFSKFLDQAYSGVAVADPMPPKPAALTAAEISRIRSVRSAAANLRTLGTAKTEQKAIDVLYALHQACRPAPALVVTHFPKLSPENVEKIIAMARKRIEDAGFSTDVWQVGSSTAENDLISFLDQAYSGGRVTGPLPPKPKAFTPAQLALVKRVRAASVAFWNLAAVKNEQQAIDLMYQLHSAIRANPAFVVSQFPELAPDDVEKSIKDARQRIEAAGLTDVVWRSGSEEAEEDLMAFLDAAYGGRSVAGAMPDKPKALTNAQVNLLKRIQNQMAGLRTLGAVKTEQQAIDLLYRLHSTCRSDPELVVDHFPELAPENVSEQLDVARKNIDDAGLTEVVWYHGAETAKDDLLTFLVQLYGGSYAPGPTPPKPVALTAAQIALLKRLETFITGFSNIGSATKEQDVIDLTYRLHQLCHPRAAFVLEYFGEELQPRRVEGQIAAARKSIEDAGMSKRVWLKNSEATVKNFVVFLKRAHSGQALPPLEPKRTGIPPATALLLARIRSHANGLLALAAVKTEQNAIDLLYRLEVTCRENSDLILEHFPDLAPEEVAKRVTAARKRIESRQLSAVVWRSGSGEALGQLMAFLRLLFSGLYAKSSPIPPKPYAHGKKPRRRRGVAKAVHSVGRVAVAGHKGAKKVAKKALRGIGRGAKKFGKRLGKWF